MYIPKYSEVSDLDLVTEVMRKHSFATVVTNHNGELLANHYPFLVNRKGESLVLLTHLARSNSQAVHLQESKSCLVIFHGPHRYISPTYYKNPLNVPTWNYVSVHVRCRVDGINEPSELERLIQDTIHHFESENQTDWKYDLPEDYRRKLLAGIVGFRMSVVDIEAKFKLSQNRKKEDYDSTILALESLSDQASQDLLYYMRKTTDTL